MSDRPGTLHVGILDDQPLFREMLQNLLHSVPGLEIHTAARASHALTEWDPMQLDVAILDFELPDGNGIEVGRSLRASNPALGIILLSAIDRVQILLELTDDERERWSYLSKVSSTSTSTLLRAIRASADGRSVIDPETIAKRNARTGTHLTGLSDRQFQVLTLVAEGFTDQAIAEKLNISVKTVSNHLNSIYSTLAFDSSSRNPRVSAVRVLLEESV